MATLASLTALGGIVGDDFTDASGIMKVITKVHADGVYTWSEVTEPIVYSDPDVMQIGDLLIQKGVLTVASANEIITLPTPFANDGYSVLMTPTSGTFGGTTIGLGFQTSWTNMSTTQFGVDFESSPSHVGFEFNWMAFGEAP